MGGYGVKRAEFTNLEELDYSGTEALNTICSNLIYSGRDLKKIVITSCMAGEGKSFMTIHIVQNLARRGKSVIMVDADLRRSFMIKRYGLETEGEWRGLAHFLAGYDELEDIVYGVMGFVAASAIVAVLYWLYRLIRRLHFDKLRRGGKTCAQMVYAVERKCSVVSARRRRI